jgi:hypothetical protein
MIFIIAYILHELGWFPHGKYRGPVSFVIETRHEGYCPSLEDCRRNDRRFTIQSPYVELLRRKVYPDLYADDEPTARTLRVLHRWREQPTVGRTEDLINVMNSITISNELKAETRDLIAEATQEILSYDVTRFTEKGGNHV